MRRTSVLSFRRIGMAAMMAIAAAAASSDYLLGQSGRQRPTSQSVSTVRPTCGTRPLSDAELAADASRVAEFKKRGTRREPGTLVTIQTYVHVLHDGVEGRISERMIRDQIAVLNDAYATRGFRFEMARSV